MTRTPYTAGHMNAMCLGLEAEELSARDVYFAMGYRNATPEAEIRAMVDEVAAQLVPHAVVRYMYGIVPATKTSAITITLDGKPFKPGGIIGSYLDDMTEACIFVATAGREFEARAKQLCADGDIVTAFIADAIGTVLAELAVSQLAHDLRTTHPLSLPYSVGYCGWDIREQKQFFTLFPPEPCGITVSDSALMTPEKSISGFAAMGESLKPQPYHCEICKNNKCYKRREG